MPFLRSRLGRASARRPAAPWRKALALPFGSLRRFAPTGINAKRQGAAQALHPGFLSRMRSRCGNVGSQGNRQPSPDPASCEVR